MIDLPILNQPPVELPEMIAEHERIWGALFDIADAAPGPWCLVGGQMVLLHALERRVQPPRASRDLDLLVDVRVAPHALRRFVDTLQRVGFSPAGIATTGTMHRYLLGDERTAVVVDVLAPDGLGPRADRVTTPPGTTIEMPAGTRALQRAQQLPVTHAGRTTLIPRPDLLGAIVAKAAAATSDGDPERHYRDLAFLCALVEDPFALAEERTPKDRRRVRRAHGLRLDHHEAWRALEPDQRAKGMSTYDVLARHTRH